MEARALSSAAVRDRRATDAWFAPVRPWLSATDPRPAGQLDLAKLNRFAEARGLRTESGFELRFVEARAAPQRPYESRIHDSGLVATRTQGAGMLHDWFNALAWLAFPRTKARLNALHARSLASDAGAARRGPLRDAATLFDENGAWLVHDGAGRAGATADEDWVALALHELDWPALFVQGRERFRSEVRVLIVGHALYEKLLDPFKSICAHTWLLAAADVRGFAKTCADEADARADANAEADAEADAVDAAGARALRADVLDAARLLPLPLLGVPGWWPDNENPAFYDDARVFRRTRTRRATAAANP